MVTGLYIAGTKVDLTEDVPVSLNFSIADIREPQNRQNSYSKTITIPSTKITDEVFTHLFEINADGGYNAKVKAEAELYVNDILQFKGYAQLKSIRQTNYRKISYDVVIAGEIMDLYGSIGNGLLEDLDLSDLNHTWDLTTIENSWTATTGEGYVYPMIDNGYSSNRYSWEMGYFRPAVYVKEYVDRIFSATGFNYDSDFFNSARFKSLIIPFNRNRMELSAAQVLDREFRVSRESTVQTDTLTQTGFDSANIDNTPVDFNDDSTGLNFNTNSQFDLTSDYWEVDYTGRYDLNGLFYLGMTWTVTSPDGGSTYKPTTYISANPIIEKSTDSGATWSIISMTQTCAINADTAFASTYTTSATPTYPDDDFLVDLQGAAPPPRNFNPPNSVFVTAQNIFLSAGDRVRVRIRTTARRSYDYFTDGSFVSVNSIPNGDAMKFYDVATPATLKTGTYELRILTGSYLLNKIDNQGLYSGNTVDMATVIPQKIRQADFLTSLIRMFNLYVQQTGDKTYKIEPRDDFYLPPLQANKEDWTYKLDNDSEMEIIPVGALDVGQFRYRYKEDKDYYNEKYLAEEGEIYGEKIQYVDTDFYKEEKLTEVIFSPTPLNDGGTGDVVLSTIIKSDGQTVSPYTGNIRILIWGGLVQAQQGILITDTVTGSTLNITEYPYAGHLDHPYTPTFDLSWDVPLKVYYKPTFQALQYTNANLYNEYYRKFIDEITDQNSKVVKAWFWLEPDDIEQLSFRKLYYFKDAFFRLHRVYDYDPVNPSITQCEFLKIKEGTAFQSLQTDLEGAYNGNVDFVEPKVTGGDIPRDGNSYDANRSVSVYGNNNQVAPSARQSTIVGDGNIIGAESERIMITGNNNVIFGGVSDVTLINTNNKEVIDSGVTYINGKLINGSTAVETVTSNRTLPEFKMAYHFDCSGGNITLTLPSVSNPDLIGNWTFVKKVDASANTLTVSPAGGKTIDGAASKVYSTQWDGDVIYLGDDFNWYLGL